MKLKGEYKQKYNLMKELNSDDAYEDRKSY